ncbi:hypothetical protein M2271_000803 [Streptomyces sp. LBL]|nr:hypothetical protein [Streptomyces sp. LBL]
MKEVCINYRTGDGEKTAALIDQELSRRFGPQHLFRASRSIAPGEAYPDSLLAALRHSSLLLAVVGPDWMNWISDGPAATAALYGRSAIAHTSSTNRSPSGARETQGSMAPSARSVAVSRRSR